MKLSLKIYGIDCAACAKQVESIFKKIGNLNNIVINFSSSLVNFECEEIPNLMAIEKKLMRFGYNVSKDKITIKCNKRLDETMIKKIEDENFQIYQIKSNSNELDVYLYPIDLRRNELIAIFQKYNITIEIKKWESGSQKIIDQSQVKLLKKLIISVCLTLPLLWNPSPYFQFCLATAILLIPGRIFLKGATKIIHGGLNMDVLIVISSLLVYIYSTYLAFTVKEDIKLYYLCEGVLISLILFGRYLEVVAKGETNRSLRGFISLLPKEARLVKGNTETLVDATQIEINDNIKVKAGERIPVDGIVISGEGLVDESMLTGESMLVKKSINSSTTCGTLLRSGDLLISVTKVGSDTTIEQMIEIVKQAQITSSPIRKLADTLVKFFVPTIIIIAIIVFSIWYYYLDKGNIEQAILCSCGVLVVSCPCALGLAIPTSIMVGTGRASELGILFKNANSIEKMKKIQVIAFDKTGTLTYGGESSDRNILRPGIKESIESLSKSYKIVMISGDKSEISHVVAKSASIDIVFSNTKPKDKAKIIKELSENYNVMMVGDGINDSPAMALSDVSVSIQNGTDLARDTASIIILGDDLSKLELAFKLSNKIMKNIYINLLWATLYNLICIPLAAIGLINPSLASAAMSFSSILVLLNSLRLKNMKG